MSPSLSLQEVSVAIAAKPIVQAITFALPEAGLVALVGPNGAGKTTLLKAVAGLLPYRGAITINGQAALGLTPNARARHVAYLPQGHQVHWPLPARDIVALGRFPHGVVDPRRMPAPDAALVTAAMAATGTLALADQPATTLSGGERARIMLARVLAVDAAIILADEPTASLDPRHQLVVMQILRDQARSGKLVIAVTHDLTLAARMADTVILMAEGRVRAKGKPEAVFTDDQLAETYGIAVMRVTRDGETAILPWQVGDQP